MILDIELCFHVDTILKFDIRKSREAVINQINSDPNFFLRSLAGALLEKYNLTLEQTDSIRKLDVGFVESFIGDVNINDITFDHFASEDTLVYNFPTNIDVGPILWKACQFAV